MQNYLFCITYQNYIFWIKKRRAFYEEARTTKITRDTVLSFAYDDMYTFITLKWSM